MFSLPVKVPKPLKSIPLLATVKSILGSRGPECGVNASPLSIPASLVISLVIQLDKGNRLNQFGKHLLNFVMVDKNHNKVPPVIGPTAKFRVPPLLPCFDCPPSAAN